MDDSYWINILKIWLLIHYLLCLLNLNLNLQHTLDSNSKASLTCYIEHNDSTVNVLTLSPAPAAPSPRGDTANLLIERQHSSRSKSSMLWNKILTPAFCVWKESVTVLIKSKTRKFIFSIFLHHYCLTSIRKIVHSPVI